MMGNNVMPLHEAALIVEDQDRLLQILKYPNPRVPLIMAERRDISEEVMRVLAGRRRANVRYTLLRYNADRLPEDVLEQLVTDIDKDVRHLADLELSRRREAITQGGAA